MAKKTKRVNNASGDSNVTSKAQVGYSAAVKMWTYEGGLIWGRFSAMVYANSILFAAIGIIISETGLWIVAFVLTIFGMLFCSCWFIMNARGFKYYEYWAKSAREIEEEYLLPIKTFSRGSRFADGKSVTLQLGGETECVKIEGLAKKSIKKTSNFMIVMFFIIYLFLLVAILSRSLNICWLPKIIQ